MITQRYNLNLIPDKVPVMVNCSQYDALSRTIEMVIYDGSTVYTIPSGTSASVRGTKQDNTGFEYPCTIDGSKVSFDIQDQMTIFAGRVPCEIRLSNNGGIIGTCNFLLNVEETPLDPDVTISETVLPLLEEAEQNATRAEAAADEAESVLSSAVKSVNSVLPDSQGNVDVDAVYSVNNVSPDSSGNVGILALPNGGTTGQVLAKQSSTDGDAVWEDRMELVSSPSVNDILITDANGQAVDSGHTVLNLKCLVLTSSSFSSLPLTISNSYITSDHVVINSVLSNPSAQTGDWTVTTNSGSLTISGSISGSTTVTLYLLMKNNAA